MCARTEEQVAELVRNGYCVDLVTLDKMGFRKPVDLDLVHIRHGVAHGAPEHVGARRPRRHRFVNESQYQVARPRPRHDYS